MTIQIAIKLKRPDKLYVEGENVTGIIEIISPTDFKHDGITLAIEGYVSLQISPKNVGVIEAFYGSIKPIQLLHSHCEINSGGKIAAGTVSIPFEIPITPKTNRTLYETYHGVYINISYMLKCDIKRPFLLKDIQKSQEFLIQRKHNILDKVREISGTKLKPIEINISPSAVTTSDAGLPDFLLKGQFDTNICNIVKPLTGYIMLEKCSTIIKSLELQLVRVETCGCAEGFAKDTTEIQNIQIGDGNIPPKIRIPIYMIFPRLFTCPTLIETNFKIEFEMNIVILFENDHLVTNNFPLILYRE